MNKDFLWRRLHSLTGLFIVLFLIEHLFVNSQAALLIGDDGLGFVKAANAIHDLPYLVFIEIFLLGVPILIHMYWGIMYLHTAQQNYYGKDAAKPILNENPRNRAYTWQRITSWILLVGIIAHVIHMRFIEYPTSAKMGETHNYMIRLKVDPGLASLSARLGFHLYDKKKIGNLKIENSSKHAPLEPILESYSLPEGYVIAITPSFGMAELLLVRETFKMPLMIMLYTIFVLAASFHAFNGLWTFMIKWGMTLTERSQSLMKKAATALMILVAFWGLAAIWITYFINLNH
jgi:succinate dehydrogenase / fumarate reductase cytochrome b subunit